MTTEIAKIEDYSALDAAIGSNIDGEPVRFKDGGYVRGFDKIEVPDGTKMMLHPVSVADGFIRWEDGRPTEWKIRELNNPAQLPVFRDTLGDTDESQWPDGKDPWAYTMMIAMRDGDGADLVFSTGSVGGKNAIRRVLKDWRLGRNKHPGKVPVVSLEADSYEHKIHRTTIEFPVFRIVDWADWDGVAAPALSAATVTKLELNDDLPDWGKTS